ncbi:MAG: glycosyltransferase family 4 protein, partial [Candidatus Micrarchaeaceae archaeon]
QIRQIWKALKMLPKNQIFAEANFISKKVNKMYRLNFIPPKLPNPIDIPKSMRAHKSDNPSIVWLGRWDPQKRVDIALNVASKMKDIDFYFIGTATGYYNFIRVETYLRKLYQNFSNIHILGFITEEEKIAYLSKAWGLLNTSVREGLPVSFLEALAYETPLISYVDPDNYVSAFGIKSKDLTVESYINAINKVVYNELYKTKGKAGRHFVEKEHETTIVMKKHISIYNKVLNS